MVSAAIEIPALPEELATMKDEGNEFFRSGEYLKAAGSYTKAIKVRPRLCQKGGDLRFVRRSVTDTPLVPSPRTRTPVRTRLNELNSPPCSRTAARVS